MADLWCVKLDGVVVRRQCTHADADRYADFLQRGFDRKRASDKRRTGEVTIAPDTGSLARRDHIYREHKTHTTISVS